MRILQHSNTRGLGVADFLFPLLLGFLSLSFQIFLMREFSVHFYGNEISYGLILAAWLLWGGVGSVSASKLRFNLSRLPHLYYLAALLFPLSLIGLRFSKFFLKILPGEITGLIPMVIFSLILSFFISFPFGILFVFNVHFRKGNLAHVYILESLGATLAGITVYFILIPFFSNWQGAVFCGALASTLVFLFAGWKNGRFRIVFVLAVLLALSLFDFPSQKIYWKPFRLILSKDSPYGKLQAIKTEEQVSLYNNSLLVYSHPDLASSEESVHFALLQNPQAKNVLLVGGGVGGGLMQVVKYPQVDVDYVEIDPEIIRISEKILPERETLLLEHTNVHTFYKDGRSFIEKVKKEYDVILLNLPEPSTAQINRFYTKEFFLKAREKLTERGILSFRVPSAENYISPELQNFLSSLYFTLKEAFPVVEIVPGDTNIFLASHSPLSLEFEVLGERAVNLDLQNTYVGPHLLFARLNPLRVDLLREKVKAGKRKINQDLIPISYFYNSVLWSAHFQGLEKKLLSFFSDIPTFWLLDFPLLLFVCLLIILILRQKKSPFYLVPLAVMGFTTIVAEILVIIAFQTFYGYLYSKVALLLTSFMAGLFIGALRSQRRKKHTFPYIILIQFGFLVLLLLLRFFLRFHPPEFCAFLFLLLLGFLGGDLFVTANQLFLKEKTNYGLGYGLDLLGSFFGALAASSLLVPLVGLSVLVTYLFLLNSFCLLFSVAGLKLKKLSS